MAKNMVVLDVETTGLDPVNCRILQIACYIPRLEKSLNLKLRAEDGEVQPKALEVNGLSMEEINSEERLSQADGCKALVEWISETLQGHRANVCCHNSEFDQAWIRNLFEREGHDFGSTFHYSWECTYKLFLTLRNLRWIKPRSVQLGDLTTYFGLPPFAAHDALGDVKATARLYFHYFKFLSTGDRGLLERGAAKRLAEAVND